MKRLEKYSAAWEQRRWKRNLRIAKKNKWRHTAYEKWINFDADWAPEGKDRHWGPLAMKISRLIRGTHPDLAFGVPLLPDDAMEFILDYLRAVYPAIKKAYGKKRRR